MLHLSFQMLPSYAYNIAFPFPFLFPFYLRCGQICASNTVVPVCLIQQLLRKDIRSRVRLNALGFMGYYFYYHTLHVCMYVYLYIYRYTHMFAFCTTNFHHALNYCAKFETSSAYQQEAVQLLKLRVLFTITFLRH